MHPRSLLEGERQTAESENIVAAFMSTQGLALRTHRERERARGAERERRKWGGETCAGTHQSRCPGGMDKKMLICASQSPGGETPLPTHPNGQN